VSFKNEGLTVEVILTPNEMKQYVFMHYLLIGMNINRRGYKLLRVSVTKSGYEATRKTTKLVSESVKCIS
jgi:hypothetical protein